MLTRRPLRNIIGRLAAALIGLSAMIASVPASAQICGSNLSRNEALADAATLGGSWAAAGTGQVPTLRFRVRAGCVEVAAPGWDWMALTPSLEVEGSYEGTVSRRSGSGLPEAVDLRFRFAGGPGVQWIEYETWYFSPEALTFGGAPSYTQGTLFHRP